MRLSHLSCGSVLSLTRCRAVSSSLEPGECRQNLPWHLAQADETELRSARLASWRAHA